MTLPVLTSSAALFLDFDGTLAAIQVDPETVTLPENGAEVLLRLADKLEGALVILSGRDVRDLARRVPPGLWRAGGHGAHVCPPGFQPPQALPDAPADLVAALSRLVDGLPGVRLEPKGRVMAVHYRQAPEHAAYLEAEISTLLEAFSGYALQSGKMVIEARPVSAHKGDCLRELMKQSPFVGRTPMMVGDDTTDEDAMLASLEAGGSAIKVGAGDSTAPFRLKDPEAVWGWLKKGML